MRQAILNLEESRIREVANAGMGRSDVLAFWFGESDEVTPDVVRQAAIDSLQRGETFYAHNLGLPELREALAATPAGCTLRPVWRHRIAITSGGVNALMLAVQALVDAGDEVVAITPVWPNLTAQPLIMGAQLRCVPLQPQPGGAWALDMPELLAAITPATRLLVVNAPNNPTGWTLTRAEQQPYPGALPRTGTWILADEVYERLYYEPTANGCAPSFLDIAEPEDRLVVVHSFSKSFLMTGWRLGWLVMPPSLTHAHGQAGGVQHLVRQRVRAARGHCRAAAPTRSRPAWWRTCSSMIASSGASRPKLSRPTPAPPTTPAAQKCKWPC
jgi:aspartate/methionine/tyrosine aminotransferase